LTKINRVLAADAGTARLFKRLLIIHCFIRIYPHNYYSKPLNLLGITLFYLFLLDCPLDLINFVYTCYQSPVVDSRY
jgi:hypothetical protein